MESFWEANSSSASQKFLWNFCKTKFHYSVKGVRYLPLPPTRTNQVTSAYYLLKTRFNINLPSSLRPSKWSLSSCFPTKTLYAPLLYPPYVPLAPTMLSGKKIVNCCYPWIWVDTRLIFLSAQSSTSKSQDGRRRPIWQTSLLCIIHKHSPLSTTKM